MRPGRRGLRPGRQPEASGQGSLRVALASGWARLRDTRLTRSNGGSLTAIGVRSCTA